MNGQGMTDDGDKKALLIIHQLNKHMSSQSEAHEEDNRPINVNRKKRGFKAKETKNQLESTGTGDVLGNFVRSRAMGMGLVGCTWGLPPAAA